MSGFLVAEKNSSETDDTASHPTLERTIVRMKTNLSGFFSSKATRVQQIVKLTVKQERDTGKLQVKIDSGLHLFSIKTNYLQRIFIIRIFDNTSVVTWGVGVRHGVLGDQHARGRVFNKG